LHLGPAFGRVKAVGLTTAMVDNFIAQKKEPRPRECFNQPVA
jgi:hypothetical protein